MSCRYKSAHNGIKNDCLVVYVESRHVWYLGLQGLQASSYAGASLDCEPIHCYEDLPVH